MQIDKCIVDKIFKHLGDDESKKVLARRLAYNLVPTHENMRELARLDSPVIIDQIQKYIDEGDKVCVYGVGKDFWHPGRVMCNLFYDKLAGAFDKDSESISEISFFGLHVPILPPERICELTPDIVVIIATQNPKYQNEIYSALLELGIPRHRMVFIPPLYSYGWGDYFYWPFFNYGLNEFFVDCGCYDGETSLLFAKTVEQQPLASISKIIAYEPNEKLFATSKKALSHIPFAQVRNMGVWNKRDTLRFYDNPIIAEGSAISVAGDCVINTVALDEDLSGERVTFIKMDVEGAELNALKGAENLIRINRPKLAICVYHKPEDILEIPEFIVNLNLGYKLYLRHQSLTQFDTILYAAPE